MNKNDQALVLSVQLLFTLQNDFFFNQNTEMLELTFMECVEEYVSSKSYDKFIRMHKEVQVALDSKPETLDFFIKRLMPSEPKFPLLSVAETKKKCPTMLLDLISLEVQFLYSIPIITLLNKYIGEAGYDFIGNMVRMYHQYKGWSEAGALELERLWAKRYEEYVATLEIINYELENDLKTSLSLIANMNIFGQGKVHFDEYTLQHFMLALTNYDGYFASLK